MLSRLDKIPRNFRHCLAWSFTTFLDIGYLRTKPLRRLSPLWRKLLHVWREKLKGSQPGPRARLTT